MMDKKEGINYIIVGILTTLVNFLVFIILTSFNISYLISNIIAIFISVVFAYIANKKYVFKNNNYEIRYLIKESSKFFLSRLSTIILDMLFIYILVDIIFIDEMISKILVNVVIIFLNYILSKKIVFRK